MRWLAALAVAAVMNNKLCELTTPLNRDADLRPITVAQSDGTRIYRRSLIFLLVTAVRGHLSRSEKKVMIGWSR